MLGSFNVKDFSVEKLKLKLKSKHVNVIDILPGGVVTAKGTAKIELDEKGEFVWQPEQDIVKAAVVERHKGTGNVGLGLIRGYGIRAGAVALSIAHDSHNIIVIGDNDRDMIVAIEELVKIGGGIALASRGEIIGSLPLEIAGLMSERELSEVQQNLDQILELAYDVLKVNKDIEPFMTLSFIALPVIPKLKLTDMGLFDVEEFKFLQINRRKTIA